MSDLQTWPGIEQVGNESQVELWVSSNQGLCGQILAAANLVRILQNFLCSLVNVTRLQGRAGALIRFELIQEDGIILAIRNVFREIVYSAKAFSVYQYLWARMLTFLASWLPSDGS